MLDNTSCQSCHQTQWKEWKTSRHGLAGDNAPFNFEYDSHPGNWCLNCHAPQKAAERMAKNKARKEGVNCLSCHLRAGKLYSTTRATNSPHQTVADSSFGDANMCARCHQFNFPELDKKGSLIAYTEQPMQDTLNEFKRSSVAKAGGTCTDCHMPKGSHRFPGSYSPAQVRKVLQLILCKTESAMQVSITNTLTAHNLPSGGVNRALVIQLWDARRPQGRREYRLERRFRGPIGKRVKIKDSTLAPKQTATWSIRKSYFSSEPSEIHLRTQFFFGTDPNRHRPTSKLEIDHQKLPWLSIPSCEPSA